MVIVRDRQVKRLQALLKSGKLLSVTAVEDQYLLHGARYLRPSFIPEGVLAGRRGRGVRDTRNSKEVETRKALTCKLVRLLGYLDQLPN
jgi:hypothetical protein